MVSVWVLSLSGFLFSASDLLRCLPGSRWSAWISLSLPQALGVDRQAVQYLRGRDDLPALSP